MRKPEFFTGVFDGEKFKADDGWSVPLVFDVTRKPPPLKTDGHYIVKGRLIDRNSLFHLYELYEQGRLW